MKLQSVEIMFEKNPRAILRGIDGTEEVRSLKTYLSDKDVIAKAKKSIKPAYVREAVSAEKKKIEKSSMESNEKKSLLVKVVENVKRKLEADAIRSFAELEIKSLITSLRKDIEGRTQ